MNGTERVRPAYIALFIALYALQGVVFAYFFNFNLGYMTEAGVSEASAAGVQSLALVPFILKFLGGPLSDRLNLLGFGHRKPYIVLGCAVQSAGLVGLAWLDPLRHSTGFAALAILTVTGLALYDTCCDGMVIDVTPPFDRTRVQGLLVAARAFAATVCSFAFGVWMERHGHGLIRFHRVLWACAGLGLIPFVLAIVLPEPQRSKDAEQFRWSALRVLVRRRSLMLLAFGALYSLVGYGVEINLSPYYKSLHFKEGAIGAFGSARYVGRAVGAATLGFAAHRLGRRRVLTIGIAALSAATAGQVLVGGSFSALLGGFGFGAANGWDDAIFFVLAMEASDPRMAASTYALFMAVSNVSVAGGWLFARAHTLLGEKYPPAFLSASIVALAALFFIPALCRPEPKAEPRDDLA